jgi:putative alpha-1,2-mannosidase
VAFVVALQLCGTALAQTVKLYDEVDPFIGTAGGGLTSPAAPLPFGIIQWGPATTERGYYLWQDVTTYGFSLTHLSGVGCPVGSDVPILPWYQEPLKSPGVTDPPYAEFVQAFDHHKEEAHPGYYSVTLANGARVELSVVDRAGIARFEFPPGLEAALLVNTGGGANTDVHMQGVPPFGRQHNRNLVKLIGDDALTGAVNAWGFVQLPRTIRSTLQQSSITHTNASTPGGITKYTKINAWLKERTRARGLIWGPPPDSDEDRALLCQ